MSPSTLRRRLVERGLVDANPKKRPKSSDTRFTADLPTQLWQSDFCYWTLANSSEAKTIT
ncbi:MAG: hypothetical protein F4X48_04890 [Acidimicrobiia bacterium]|nr:hypothetical protein [Acidimicrobiia bacterium]MYC57907.1 hypothetical protein [Acidimicrobiia bacterium]MYI29785.1 hypothetical protein [Acidimicrobiia bacterium]